MRSGTKNCYVSVYRLVESTDPDTNAPSYASTFWKSCWAFAAARKGRELEVDGQIVARTYVRFEFDYFDIEGITTRDVIEYDGIRYSVSGLLPDLATKEIFVIDADAQAAGTERT